MDGSNAMRIILEGQANNGGFAIDDISFHPGECTSKFFKTTFPPFVNICLCFEFVTFSSPSKRSWQHGVITSSNEMKIL